MPSLQTTILQDRETTPVNHTFIPDGMNSGVGTVKEPSSDGVVLGENRLSVATRYTADRVHNEVRLVVPIMATETINGVSIPKVVRTGYVTCKFSFSRSSTEQERNNVVGMIASAFEPSRTLVNDAVVKAQDVYSD